MKPLFLCNFFLVYLFRHNMLKGIYICILIKNEIIIPRNIKTLSNNNTVKVVY